MRSNYKKLGQFIKEVSVKNKDLSVELLLGVSITKQFIPSIANTVGTDMSKYKVVEHHQFAYGPVTSRNGEKISVALLGEEKCIVSTSYTVFEIVDTERLDPEYLMMWFRRLEFDRYARYMSHGTVRELFGWQEMCDVELPVPSIEKQREIVREYNVVNDRIALNEQLTKKLDDTAQAIYKQWFVDFEFPISKEYAESIGKPELEGKPYKSSAGEMEFCEALSKDVPINSELKSLGDICTLITDGKHGNCVDEEGSGYYFISVKDINNGSIDYTNSRQIVKADFEETHRRTAFSAGDILFTNTGSIGRMVILEDEPKTYRTTCQKSVAILKPDYSEVDTYFLYSLLRDSIGELQELAGGTSQANLLLGDMRSYLVLIPQERERIAFSKLIKKTMEYFHLLNKEQTQLNNLKSVVLQKMSKA